MVGSPWIDLKFLESWRQQKKDTEKTKIRNKMSCITNEHDEGNVGQGVLNVERRVLK